MSLVLRAWAGIRSGLETAWGTPMKSRKKVRVCLYFLAPFAPLFPFFVSSPLPFPQMLHLSPSRTRGPHLDAPTHWGLRRSSPGCSCRVSNIPLPSSSPPPVAALPTADAASPLQCPGTFCWLLLLSPVLPRRLGRPCSNPSGYQSACAA